MTPDSTLARRASSRGKRAAALLAEFDPARAPAHVADHHGRQRPVGGEARACPRLAGHRAGAKAVREAIARLHRARRPLPHHLLVLLGELEPARRRGLRAHDALRRGARARARPTSRSMDVRVLRHRPDGRRCPRRRARRSSACVERTARQRRPHPRRRAELRRPRRDRRRGPRARRATSPRARSTPTTIDEDARRVAPLHRRASPIPTSSSARAARCA